MVAKFGEPRVVVTPSRDIAFAMLCRAMDKLRSYIKPIKTLASDADHRAHKGINNAIEVSHPLTDSGLLANHERGQPANERK